ncbi:hypothetical protein HELRODRAFT_175882 [Helobdella robusta]|uniref:Uncharacterized protein n=1 Tax=Helobdella robusta TaxID=6412 RepID=T1F9T8_HELRO|nr:hypothetical protein HELRODRAFT_175882 [Helobdella robusta]ESO00449.1 hypothetical protein HELRODRAFT_175882 [Helobdella robusta]
MWKVYIVARAAMSKLVAALTSSFPLENCAEEPAQRMRMARKASWSSNQFVAIKLPNKKEQSKQDRNRTDQSYHEAQRDNTPEWAKEDNELHIVISGIAAPTRRRERKRPSRWGLELTKIFDSKRRDDV